MERNYTMTTTQDTPTECLVGRRITTADELAALDPDTVLMNMDRVDYLTQVRDWLDGDGNPVRGAELDLPAVVIATGDQTRAARQALEEEA